MHSLEDYTYALMMAMSRTYESKKGESSMTWFVPFVDMMNHKYPEEDCTWTYDNNRKGFTIKANRDIPAGQ